MIAALRSVGCEVDDSGDSLKVTPASWRPDLTDPADLAGAFQRAVAVVKRGPPALVDVVSQGR